jgi:sRNA-binding regulator protein Hfq
VILIHLRVVILETTVGRMSLLSTHMRKSFIDARTEMIIVLRDGEEIVGTIEWYDRHALKINREGLPNLLLLKNNIKYMYKAEDRPVPAPKTKKK